jgi:hypothetical protein
MRGLLTTRASDDNDRRHGAGLGVTKESARASSSLSCFTLVGKCSLKEQTGRKDTLYEKCLDKVICQPQLKTEIRKTKTLAL